MNLRVILIHLTKEIFSNLLKKQSKERALYLFPTESQQQKLPTRHIRFTEVDCHEKRQNNPRKRNAAGNGKNLLSRCAQKQKGHSLQRMSRTYGLCAFQA